ncbi:NAD-dependent epimerase/dehydratase family protein [Oceanicoccus sagamiensis]|uniref:GDP-mannose 4,6 dehydratase n=1 Tax=Oceanicoccus sagamiensis TaxID=716816 RepID=A0A1X9NA69_9GAMM|nr:NAD-dependent epimerase/dehydratase family protein [Oceanicoccus sagamiensis]ARN74948.1 GDP-mannose 4,6 dehydratase [Oceanicoccus sagamiensis]
MSPPRALITGISGFTGDYIAAELSQRGYDIFGFGAESAQQQNNRYSINLSDQKAIRELVETIQPDVVVHLAAISFVAHGDIDAIYQANITGTRNLLSALVEAGVNPDLVVLASSANIYGNTHAQDLDPSAVLNETTIAAPANDYAVSKLAMEHMARLWMEQLPITIVRPFNYTGVGQSERFLLPKIVSHFQRGDHRIELGNIDVVRDFSDVRDIAAAYGGLIDAKPAGEVFNLCSGSGHSLTETLDMMRDIAGYSIKVEVNPAFVRDNEVKQLVGCNDKLKATVGNYSPIPLRQTLEWMYKKTDG